MPAEDNPQAGRALRWVGRPLVWALLLGLWWCALELLWASTAESSRTRPGSVALALGLILVPCTVLGALLQLGAVLASWDPLGSGASSPRQALRRLVRGQPASRRVRAAWLLALGSALGLYAALAARATEHLVVAMAQPRFTAIAIGAAHLFALACAALAALALYAPSALVVKQLAKLPRVGDALATPKGLLLCALVVATLGLGTGLLRQRELASFLPWRSVLPGLAAACLASLDVALLPRLPARIRRGLGLAVVVSSALTLLGTGLLGPTHANLRREALGFSHGARLGADVTERLFDFDGDSHVHVMAGGDCAPFDAQRHPGALDVPDNGKDEDCDGSDVQLARVTSPVTRAYTLPAEVPAQPPIVLLTVDAFAARRMRALGGGRSVTPNIDALAERSALFTACFSQGPSTRLSFPSIFTSRYDTQIRRKLVGKHPYPLEPSEKLLAQVVSRAGYDSVAVVSDSYFGRGRWSSLTRGFARVIESPIRGAARGGHNSALVTDAAIAELKRPRKQPLFLWLHYYDAHSPHQQPAGIPQLGTARADVYDAELMLVDREVGRFVEALRAQLPEALLVLSADHGIAFDEPRHEKLNYGYDLYTVTLHVPLLFNAPFIAARHHDGVVSTMDIAPTLAALVRARGKQPFEGVSLWPELMEAKRERTPRLVHQFFITERRWKGEEPLELISLRTDQYDLIHDRRDGSYQLYDWRKDYLEQNDLADSAEQRPQLNALKQQLSALSYHLYDPQANPPAPEARPAK